MIRSLSVFLLLPLLVCSCQEDFDTRLQRESAEYTRKHCPQKLDAYTTLDSVVYVPVSKTYTRYLSLATNTPTDLFKHSATVRDMLLRELKGDAGWKRCKDEHIHFSYIYHWAKDGSTAYSVTFSPNDYNY